MKNQQLVKRILIGILGAISIILRMLDFPILPAAPFLKVDFSDMPVLLGLLVNGPWGAVGVAAIRDVLNFLIKGGEAGLPIGATMSFIASMSMFLPSHFIFKKLSNNDTKLGLYIQVSLNLFLGLVFSMAIVNYFVALPLYIQILHFPIDNLGAYLLTIIVPFNILKGVILSIGQIILLNRMVPFLIQRGYLYEGYQERHLKLLQ